MGHLNGILAQEGGNLNNNFQKKLNAQGVARGGGILKLRFDRYIMSNNFRRTAVLIKISIVN